MSFRVIVGVVLVAMLATIAGGQALPTSSEKSAPKLSDASDGRDWPGFGRTYGEQHFSPLTQIDEKNVGRLALDWSLDLGQGNSTSGPIAVEGVLYFVTGYSVVHAVDVLTAKSQWLFNPKAAEAAGRNLRLGWGSRGVAWWNGKIYVGTQDGRLIALDAKTGEPVWSVQTFNPADPRYISGAPRVFDGKVAIGNAGDMGAVRGYVTTYDAETGKRLWRFYTVPGNPADGFENQSMAKAAKTWSGRWWKFGGNGTVWNAMTYDAGTDTLFIDTGNAYPIQPRIRTGDRGDNLYTSSIIALNAKTGAYKWHYQFVPRDAWDYDSAMDMQLGELSINGQARKVLVVAPKNGFFYVFDRTSGRLISAEPFAKVTWASRIDIKTGRPVENPAARFPNGTTAEVWPSAHGAHTWLPMAFSSKSNLVYIPVMELGMTISDSGRDTAHWLPPTDRTTDDTVNLSLGIAAPTISGGKLLAWNPATQKPVWEVPQPSFATGGVLATAGGLVFQGAMDGTFNAYADMTGKRIWSFAQDTPIIAPPISYSVNGRQYVTVLTGLATGFDTYGPKLAAFHIDPRTQARRVLTFSLDGKATLPAAEQPAPLTNDPNFNPDQKSVEAGELLYGHRCLICHGASMIGAGHAPDLRRSAVPLSAEAFAAVVHDCALVPNGMPCFDELTEKQLSDLRQYLRTRDATAVTDTR